MTAQPIRFGIVVLSLVAVGDAQAARQPLVATFEGRVASVTPSGDNEVGDPSDAGKPSKHDGKASKHEMDDAQQSPCALQSGSILACAMTLESEEATCSPVRESDCEFSVEVPLEHEADVAGLFFVQDDDASEDPGRGEAEAELIDEQEGAPVCNDDVFRVDEVNVDFAQAAPSADSIDKIVDACAES